ncbi:MAG: tetratricopeptide repeat protein [Deltaproteobacteria bacterium]|nr:tetratricopeptide repeat protein [Deltaproteobacteria bacterium]
MNIPWTYYLEYWFKNSMLALATGFLITFLIPPLFAAVPLFGIFVCLIYQVILYRHFWGKRRGEFEFFSKENLIKKNINSILKQYLGRDELVRFKVERFNNIVKYGWDVYEKLMKNTNAQKEEFRYYINMMAADFSRKEGDLKKERNYLLKTVSSFSDDLVGNYRLAVAYEKEGRSKESIKHYRTALENSSIDSSELKEFIQNQIIRVMEKGPRKSPPVPTLKFMTW